MLLHRPWMLLHLLHQPPQLLTPLPLLLIPPKPLPTTLQRLPAMQPMPLKPLLAKLPPQPRTQPPMLLPWSRALLKALPKALKTQ
jgi:hypothetical protein